jgi:hypothetical protein
VANAVSDDDLIGMLDSRFWLARSGSVALGLPGTLRKHYVKRICFPLWVQTQLSKCPTRNSVSPVSKSKGSGTESASAKLTLPEDVRS